MNSVSKMSILTNQMIQLINITIQTKPVQVKSNTNIDLSKEINDKDSKFKIVVNGLNGEEIFGTFYKNELQKSNQKEFRIKKYNLQKAIKR